MNEKILLNPNVDISGAIRKKKEKKQGIVIDKASNVKQNIDDALYDRIRSLLYQRKGELTVVYRWNEVWKRYEIGLASPWGFIYAMPPTDQSQERAFADALYDKRVETNKMGEDAVKLRVYITGGQV
jgi:hypothetical protein